ncbi:hypothetical protein [Butyrivibrio sp. WCE2006]|uniref:hypothetical protein n=1 Tax=Butyrivibrio sp. WCE2006 TaxID=1410611 RepID=UPI000B0C3BA5|nr:hypothetical protein [Butyrivibrio sp. WCE2006]
MSRQNELFGKKCRDKLTGFEGICFERITWLYGCDKYSLRQIKEDGQEYKAIPRTFSPNSLITLETVIEVDPNRDEQGKQEEFFGKLCRDKVTGFEGICTGRMTSLFDSDSYCLEPKAKKKSIHRNCEWFDEGRIEIIGYGISPEEVQSERPGGMDSYPNHFAEYSVLK